MNPRLLLTTLLLSAGVSMVFAQETERSEADRTRRATVLAKFEGGQVTVGDLEDDIASQSRFMRKRYLEQPERRTQRLRFLYHSGRQSRETHGLFSRCLARSWVRCTCE